MSTKKLFIALVNVISLSYVIRFIAKRNLDSALEKPYTPTTPELLNSAKLKSEAKSEASFKLKHDSLEELRRDQAIAHPFDFSFNDFRTQEITKEGEANDTTDVDKQNYKLYVESINSLIKELNSREADINGLEDSDPTKQEIVRLMAIVEFLERKNGYNNLQ